MSDDTGRWMTFAELAEARGTTKWAAVALVRRHRWRKQRNNAGHVLTLVPPGWDRPAAVTRPNGSDSDRHDAGWSDPAKDGEIATLRDMVSGLRDTVARAETLAAHAEARAKEADARVEQAEALLADLGAKVARLNQAEADARRANAEAQEARQAAEALQTAVAELKAERAIMQDKHAVELKQRREGEVVRIARAEANGQRIAGEAARAAVEQARADARQAEAAIEALRRADEARKGEGPSARRLGRLAGMVNVPAADDLRDRLAAAQAELQQARQTAEALRQAETVRNARGRLRRAWDGWRGR